MNWSVWDTLFIIVGVVGLVATALMWRFSSMLTRVLGLVFGAILVLFGFVAGLQLEWTYPLPMLALPVVPIILALVVDLPKLQKAGTLAPAPAAAPLAPTAPVAEQRGPASTTETAATTPAPSKLDDAPQAGPDASHEDIDAALADWYFDPSAGRTKTGEGQDAADDIEWDAPATATRDPEMDDADRSERSAHAAGPVADFGEGYTYEETRDDEDAASISYPDAPVGQASHTDSSTSAEAEQAIASTPAVPRTDDEWTPDEGPDAETVLAGDAAPAHQFTREQAMDPATPAATLHEIAAAAPELHAALAANPALYPSLREWLATSPEQDVQDALAKNPGQ